MHTDTSAALLLNYYTVQHTTTHFRKLELQGKFVFTQMLELVYMQVHTSHYYIIYAT